MTFREAMAGAVVMTVRHACGHTVEWLLVIKERRPEDVRAEMEAQECGLCRQGKELGAEWS